MNLLREAAGLPHEVGQGVVPVRRVSLREEGGVLETWWRTIQLYHHHYSATAAAPSLLTYVFPPRHPGEEVVDVLVLLRHRHLRPDQVQQQRRVHDGPAVDHRVMRLPWGWKHINPLSLLLSTLPL